MANRADRNLRIQSSECLSITVIKVIISLMKRFKHDLLVHDIIFCRCDKEGAGRDLNKSLDKSGRDVERKGSFRLKKHPPAGARLGMMCNPWKTLLSLPSASSSIIITTVSALYHRSDEQYKGCPKSLQAKCKGNMHRWDSLHPPLH